MVPPKLKRVAALGKARVIILVQLVTIFSAGCTRPLLPAGTLTFMVDRPPPTLNPRQSIDATGQRIGALLFRALTRADSNLTPQADLATDWEVLERGKLWKFRMKPNVLDQAGQPITAQDMAQCLENYVRGKPVSPLAAAFPYWTKALALKDTISIELRQPDVYLADNLSALKFFRLAGTSDPCVEPKPHDLIIGSGGYRATPWIMHPEAEIQLLPVLTQAGARPLRFTFVPDDNVKVLNLMRGSVDGIENLTLTKTKWAQVHLADRYRFLERKGVVSAYLAFNLADPVLANRAVRRAIALAIPREEIVREKLFGFCQPSRGLLAPLLSESFPVDFSYDPAQSIRLLDQAGYRADKNGVRLKFKFKTTPVREGYETALIFQDALRKIGIELELDLVEPAVFIASIKKRKFQMYASRWVGIANGSILYRTLYSESPDNRVSYRDAEMDQWLNQANSEPEAAKRKVLLAKVQRNMAEDLPYFPLWYWDNLLILKKELGGLTAEELSLSGALEPLTHLR